MCFLTVNNEDAIKKLNRQGIAWEKVFVKPDKTRVSRMYRECLQFNNKETNNPNSEKWAKDLNGHFTREDENVPERRYRSTSLEQLKREIPKVPRGGNAGESVTLSPIANTCSGSTFSEDTFAISYQVKHKPTHVSATLLLRIYPRQMNT